MKILVTGGAGYIGSHTVVELLHAGHDVVVVDNFCNSNERVLQRIEEITRKTVEFVNGDVRDRALLDRLFADHSIQVVVHFAGLKAVGESFQKPLEYYDNNVLGTLVLCQAMAASGVFRLVFSSSATVYGAEAPVPYVETTPRGAPSSPYGASKAMVERLLEDQCNADSRWSVVILRYFNPAGAHPSGLIGEDPAGVPNNLMPYISQVAIKRQKLLAIYGSDYNTLDGTCVRDYIHVVDLATGHLRAIDILHEPGVHHYNLGLGQGVSVLEMVNAFVRTNGVDIPYKFAPRREGDLAAFWADASKIKKELGWKPTRTLEDIMRDTWNWQSLNPSGYSPS